MAQRAKRIAEENSHHDCDFRDMLSRVGDKWSLLVIFILKGRPAFRGRFSDLKRSIPGISQRMLTATVRNLERDGMLTRHVYAEVPPRVEYELTPLGRGLTEPVLGLVSWLQSNWPAIRSARDRFDARKKRPERSPGPLPLQQSAADDREPSRPESRNRRRIGFRLFGQHLIGYERQGCSRAVDVVLHRGRPAHPDRPDKFSIHLDRKPSPRTPPHAPAWGCRPRATGRAG